MLTSRAYSVLDICRFFGVAPFKVFHYESVSYSSIEAQNNAFLQDTLQPIISKIEAEFTLKLFSAVSEANMCVRFSLDDLLRGDINTQTTAWQRMFYAGCLSPNDLRRKMGLPDIGEEGDTYFVQSNCQSIERAISNPIGTTTPAPTQENNETKPNE